MRKVVLSAAVLALSSPAYAIGFWVDGSLGLGLFSHGSVYTRSETDGSASEATYDYTGSGSLFGGGFSGGISLSPAPVLLGLGLSFYTGSGKSEGTVGSIRTTSEWNASLVKVGLPVAYRVDVAPLTFLLGVAPSYSSMTFTDKDGGDSKTYSGVGVGLFGKGFFRLGALGLGGGVYLDYVPALSNTEENTILGQTVTTTTTIKGNTILGINLGFLLLTGLLE